MVTRLNSYLDSVSAFDSIEINLLSFSSNPLRSTEEDLSELVSSIRQHGLLEPIIVRPRGDRFEVVAGNRRLKACRLLKHRKVKCIVTDLDDSTAYEVSLIENVQRKTLDPLEEALAFKKYCEKSGWGSQSELARKIGKSQEYISHRIRLLDLPEKVKAELRSGGLSPTAAQELVWLKEKDCQAAALEVIKKNRLNTKSVRGLVSFTNASLSSQVDDYAVSESLEERDEVRSIKVLTESILVLRIALARIDGIILKAQNPQLKDALLSKRIALHRLVDELIQVKKLGFGHMYTAPTIKR
jgi:ParB family chromosome partitioning protein